jgi:hypothetical protein
MHRQPPKHRHSAALKRIQAKRPNAPRNMRPADRTPDLRGAARGKLPRR